ncbi:MAG: hypothetical protein MI863_09070 [Desulfobacterales bacterium]|nr:hypothetical protein [Desulfobacterales bacterium]
MSLSINTNTAALTAHRNMVRTDSAMTQSIERLSTGLRINRAADDASGMAIADSLRAQHMGIGQAVRNANDGVAIVQTADGALEESINIVNTIKTKSIQAASDGQTPETRAAIQADIDRLNEELDAISTTTSYNGQQLLDGGFTQKKLQVGASANETASINISSTHSTETGHVTTSRMELEDPEGGEVQLTINSAITGEDVELETVDIQSNNQAENGMGALAAEINSETSNTGVSAEAVVEVQTSGAVEAGTTGEDFAINGQVIGSVDVEDNDSDAALAKAINDKSSETGVVAILEPDGSMTLTSVDGRAIEVTGDTGGVFGEDTNEEMSTIGYINLTQEGTSQIEITANGKGGSSVDVVLDEELETVSDSVLGTGSQVAAGSEFGEGTALGGTARVGATVEDTQSAYEVSQGSSIAAGSTISQGTVLGGEITVGGELGTGLTEMETDTLVAEGSTLAAGTVIEAGTVVTTEFEANGVTYEKGAELSVDVTLDEEITLTDDMVLEDGSRIAAGSTLAAGSALGADVSVGMVTSGPQASAPTGDLTGTTTADAQLTAQADLTGGAVTLEQGSVITDGSQLNLGTTGATYNGPDINVVDGSGANVTVSNGDTLTADTVTVTMDGDQALGADLTTGAGGATLESGSILETGTALGGQNVGQAGYVIPADLSAANPDSDIQLTSDTDLTGGAVTLKEGSVLTDGSTVDLQAGHSGPTLTVQDSAGNVMTISDGDTITAGEYTVVGDQALTDDLTTGTSGATLTAGSVISQDSTFTGQTIDSTGYNNLTRTDAVMTEDMTLNAGSELATGSELSAGTVLGDETQVMGSQGGAYVSLSETELSLGSTLGEGSGLGEGSTMGGEVTVARIDSLEADMDIEAGSTLEGGTTLTAGTTVNQDMTLMDGTTEVEVKAGDTLTEDLTVATGDAVVITEDMTLKQGSSVEAGSELIINTDNDEAVVLSDQEKMTLADISVMTQEDAQLAIAIADAALKDLDQTRSELGSVQNQLTSTIANLSVTKTNIQASESNIRDIDFAEETSNFAKLQLLSQTGSYALSQANASAQNLMSLLQ